MLPCLLLEPKKTDHKSSSLSLDGNKWRDNQRGLILLEI